MIQAATPQRVRFVCAWMLIVELLCFIFLFRIIAKNNSVLPYMALTGVFGALTLVLLLAFLVIVVCLYICHRKRMTGNKCFVH